MLMSTLINSPCWTRAALVGGMALIVLPFAVTKCLQALSIIACIALLVWSYKRIVNLSSTDIMSSSYVCMGPADS